MPTLDALISMRQAGQLAEAEAALREALAGPWAQEAEAWYQLAWCCDAQGKEAEAAPAYEQALALGLQGESLRGALLGLGSTYRWLKQPEAAIATLERGVAAFPGDWSMKVFRALAWHQGGRSDEAVASLVEALAATSGDPQLRAYAKALAYVSADLRGEALD